MKTKSVLLLGLIAVLALPAALVAQSPEPVPSAPVLSLDTDPAALEIPAAIPSFPLDPLAGALFKSCDTCWDGYLECAFGCGGAACIYVYDCNPELPCGYACFCQPCPW